MLQVNWGKAKYRSTNDYHKTERDGQINIIPDAFGNGGTLVEFKNVQYLTDTQQLRGMGQQENHFSSKYEYKDI